MNGTTRKLVIAISISLALNLFFAGFLVARAVLGRGHGGRFGGDDPHGPFGALMGEPQAWRSAEPQVRDVMKRHHESLRARGGELRQAQREVADALTAEPFDRARLERALATTRAQTEASQKEMHDGLIELAASIGPEERRRLARTSLHAHSGESGGRRTPHHERRRDDERRRAPRR